MQGRYLEGGIQPFQTVKDRRGLVGKWIRYLRLSDIDRSGRGYFFPRVGFVDAAKGTQLILDGGDSLSRGDLVELQIVEPNSTKD